MAAMKKPKESEHRTVTLRIKPPTSLREEQDAAAEIAAAAASQKAECDRVWAELLKAKVAGVERCGNRISWLKAGSRDVDVHWDVKVEPKLIIEP
jgi:hypothetical protein